MVFWEPKSLWFDEDEVPKNVYVVGTKVRITARIFLDPILAKYWRTLNLPAETQDKYEKIFN